MNDYEFDKWHYQLFGKYHPDNKARKRHGLPDLPKTTYKPEKLPSKNAPKFPITIDFTVDAVFWDYPKLIDHAKSLTGQDYSRNDIKRILPKPLKPFPMNMFIEIMRNPTKPSHHIIHRIWQDDSSIIDYTKGEIYIPPTGLEPITYEEFEFISVPQKYFNRSNHIVDIYYNTGRLMQPPYPKTNNIVDIHKIV